MSQKLYSSKPNVWPGCRCRSVARIYNFWQKKWPIFVSVEEWRLTRLCCWNIKVSQSFISLHNINFYPTYRVIGDRELPPEGFSLLSRTADTEQKAWRKRQIAYKLSKRGSVTQAVTDVILCSKLKLAPDGFVLAG